MGQWFLILLLPFAAWSGWWVSMRKEARDLRRSKSRSAYFEGISYLLNDQTERAVDVFISMADVDEQTIDNQLTLGRLFRKRGELDRALHMHQQLMSYEGLTTPQKQSVQLELALDYDQAGMVVQAQELLEDLLEDNYELKVLIPTLLLIYERTNQWHKLIELANYRKQSGHGSFAQKIAHYYCELAQEALSSKNCDKEAVASLLDKALNEDRDCARANWMLGEFHLEQKQYISAIHAFQSIASQQLMLIPDVLPQLEAAYVALDRYQEYVEWLMMIETQYQKVRITRAYAQIIAKYDSTQAAAMHLKDRLDQQSNPLLFADYLYYRSQAQDPQYVIQPELIKSIEPQTIYQCDECGFRQQRLIWHCPACAAWGSFQPVVELKIEQR